jgi:hypothetical protein
MARTGNTKAIASPYGGLVFPERNGLCERKEFHEDDGIPGRKITDLESGGIGVGFSFKGVCQDRRFLPQYG